MFDSGSERSLGSRHLRIGRPPHPLAGAARRQPEGPGLSYDQCEGHCARRAPSKVLLEVAPRRTQPRSHGKVPPAGNSQVAFWKAVEEDGAAYRTRTCDPRITKAGEARRKSYIEQRLRCCPVCPTCGDPRGTQTDRCPARGAPHAKAPSRGKSRNLDLRYTCEESRNGRISADARLLRHGAARP